MRNKFYLILVAIFIISPLTASADGGVVRPLPDGDLAWVEESSQQAFINYEGGIEKLVIGADIKEENSDIAWIVPVPSKPENVAIDITPELPIFFGDDVISKAKLSFSEDFTTAYFAGLLGQLWTLPLSVAFVSFPSASGGSEAEMALADSVSIENHLEKAGMVTEVITAKNSQAIYNYFSQKGFNLKQGSLPELDSYINENYSFVVSWIAPGMDTRANQGQRGIFMSFPTSKIYYPLMLTSVYQETKIPITIRVLGHVKPEVFSDIKPYAKVSYFIERTKGRGGARGARCQGALSQLRSVIAVYYSNYGGYPSSLQSLETIEDSKPLFQEMGKYCVSPPLYTSKDKDNFTMLAIIGNRLFVINSTGFADFVDEASAGDKLVPPELKKFYGDKKPWAGEAEYTKITIDSPAKLLKKDLWMEKGRPLEISFALWVISNPWAVILILYLLIVSVLSFIAGGLAGLLCFRKFKKYALLGFANILTLLGLYLNFRYIKRKTGEDVKRSKSGFISSFSIIFLLLNFLLMIFYGLADKSTVLLVALTTVWAVVGWIILRLVKFLLDKIKLKNKVARTILTIILCVILVFAAMIMIFSWVF